MKLLFRLEGENLSTTLCLGTLYCTVYTLGLARKHKLHSSHPVLDKNIAVLPAEGGEPAGEYMNPE